MLLIKVVLVVLWFGVIPYCIGLGFTSKRVQEENSFWLNVFCGYLGMFGLFQLLCVPGTFFGVSFGSLVMVMGSLTAGWALVTALVQRRRLAACSVGHISLIRGVPAILWVAFLFIGIQIAVSLGGMSSDLDDALYVAAATTSIESNGLFTENYYTGAVLSAFPKRYVLSPFPVFLGFISRVTGFHPTVVAHTIMPVFFIALAYGVYGLLGRKLFQGDRKAVGLFLCFLSLIHVFSYYSVYTQGTFMLIRIWQGKATLAGVLLPALFYLAWEYFDQEGRLKEWVVLFFLMLSCCLVSSMGIMLAPIMLGIMAFILGVCKRQWKKVFWAFLCCVPSAAYAGIYLLM